MILVVFIHPFHVYLLSAFGVTGTVLDTPAIAVHVVSISVFLEWTLLK